MRADALAEVKREMKRLSDRIDAYETAAKPYANPDYQSMPERAAVRRASMDLTKALARLRK